MREGTARAPLAGKRSRVLEAWCTDGVAEVTHGLLHSCAGSRMINFRLNQKLKKLDHFLVLSFQVSQLWQLAEGPSPSFVVLKAPVFQFQSECFDFGFTRTQTVEPCVSLQPPGCRPLQNASVLLLLLPPS